MSTATANPFARDTAGKTRWVFGHTRITKKGNTEHHELVEFSCIRQNHHEAAKLAMAHFGCEKAQLKDLSKEPAGPPHAYVAHKLSAKTKRGMDRNRARASRWVAYFASQGYAPHASWIPLSAALEETPENRAKGLALDLLELGMCDVAIFCGKIGDLDKSSGMQGEKAEAERLGKRVVECWTKSGEPPK